MLMYLRKKLNKKGFTLIELVVVIAILGILSAIVIPKFTNVTTDAQQQAVQSNVRVAVSAVQMYMAANGGTFPDAGADLDSYIQGGWAGLADKPVTGTTYTLAAATGGGVTITGKMGSYTFSETVQ